MKTNWLIRMSIFLASWLGMMYTFDIWKKIFGETMTVTIWNVILLLIFIVITLVIIYGVICALIFSCWENKKSDKK